MKKLIFLKAIVLLISLSCIIGALAVPAYADRDPFPDVSKADAVFLFSSVAVKHKRFWDLLGGKADTALPVGSLDIFFCHRRDRRRVGIKDPHNVRYADVLIVSYV